MTTAFLTKRVNWKQVLISWVVSWSVMSSNLFRSSKLILEKVRKSCWNALLRDHYLRLRWCIRGDSSVSPCVPAGLQPGLTS